MRWLLVPSCAVCRCWRLQFRRFCLLLSPGRACRVRHLRHEGGELFIYSKLVSDQRRATPAGSGLSSSSSCVCAGALAVASAVAADAPLTKRVALPGRTIMLRGCSCLNACVCLCTLGAHPDVNSLRFHLQKVGVVIPQTLSQLLPGALTGDDDAVRCDHAGGGGVRVHLRAVRRHAVRRHGPGHLPDGHARRRAAHQLRPSALYGLFLLQPPSGWFSAELGPWQQAQKARLSLILYLSCHHCLRFIFD